MPNPMIELFANLTCPECGYVKHEQMPDNYWVTIYRCASCGASLHPKPGDCCVYCSFSDQHCPSRQRENLENNNTV